MLVSYSKQDGFVKAAKDTFSGEKPCDLCCKIKHTRESAPDSKDPVVPVSPLSAKILQEMLPGKTAEISPPTCLDAPPVVFSAVNPPRGIGKDSPPVPPPCLAA